MGDIQTFIDGIDLLHSRKRKATSNRPRGGGNVSLPIPISTGLELVAALYVGKTKYMANYNATENVILFLEKYFPGRSRRIPRIIWDGARNGIDHTFQPKVMKRKKDYIRFTFYVYRKSVPSFITKKGNTIKISFNSIEYYKILKQAIRFYKADLKAKRDLQEHFIRAWKSIERQVNNVDSKAQLCVEADYLRNNLKTRQKLKLF